MDEMMFTHFFGATGDRAAARHAWPGQARQAQHATGQSRQPAKQPLNAASRAPAAVRR